LYAHFSKLENGRRKLVKVDERPPNSSDNKPKKTKKIAKKAKAKKPAKAKVAKAKAQPKVKKNPNESYNWLLNQLKDKSDLDLNTQRCSSLLENLLSVLQRDEGVSDYDVLRFLEKVKTDMNFKDVMQYFKIRRNKTE
jgi:hypothetical protein